MGLQKASSFLYQAPGPSRQETEREGGACPDQSSRKAAGSACLKEKLFFGAHGGSTWPPTASAVGRLVREEVLGKSPAQGGRPSGRLRFSGP